MFSAIYIEREVAGAPRVRQILARFPGLPHIECERYGELFNRKAQNFRLQKRAPALILARKHGRLVLPAPAGYGFGNAPAFYFSHMLNCPYDCRYCFLQGMYRSANYVLFVNYEDFQVALGETLAGCGGEAVFYSGYDCDSLALEPVSAFCTFLLPRFRDWPAAVLEIRTKSTQIRSLLKIRPLPNVVIAMSFTPAPVAARLEHRVAPVDKRIQALRKLQQAGWRVALRFEPLIVEAHMLDDYRELFERVFGALDTAALHSVSTGEFRIPADYYRNVARLYPDEALYARPTVSSDGVVRLCGEPGDFHARIEQLLTGFISPRQYYRCA